MVSLLLASVLVAQNLPVDLLEKKLRTGIEAIDARLGGTLGVAAIDLYNGHTILYNADTIFPAASTIKVPILIEVFRSVRAGELKLSDSVTLQPSESVGGSGNLQQALKQGPVTLSIMDLVVKMMIDSDNTATNHVIGMVKMDRVNRLLQELGAKQTRLRRIMMDTDAALKGNENVTTPLEMARIMEGIYRDKAASVEDCSKMVQIMKGVSGEIRNSVPKTSAVASKTGSLTGVHCETAIVYLENRPFALSVYSSFLGATENPVGEVSKLVFEYFQRLSKSNSYGNQVR